MKRYKRWAAFLMVVLTLLICVPAETANASPDPHEEVLEEVIVTLTWHGIILRQSISSSEKMSAAVTTLQLYSKATQPACCLQRILATGSGKQPFH